MAAESKPSLGKYHDRIVDDLSPIARRLTSKDFKQEWGKNGVDRKRDDFSPEEAAIANKIGMPPRSAKP
jgi:hypothetical protein